MLRPDHIALDSSGFRCQSDCLEVPRTISSSAGRGLTGLHPLMLRGPGIVSGIKLGSATCKADALTPILRPERYYSK